MVHEKLIARVMRLYGLRTKREAIDFALRSVAGRYEPRDILELAGMGWPGDLRKMRTTRFPRI